MEPVGLVPYSFERVDRLRFRCRSIKKKKIPLSFQKSSFLRLVAIKILCQHKLMNNTKLKKNAPDYKELCLEATFV